MSTITDAVPSVALEIADGDEIGTTQIARERQLEISTIFRWIVKGLPAADGNRVKLAAVKRGKSWLTSRAALRRFFAALPTNTSVDSPPRPQQLAIRSSAKRQADDERVRQQLKDKGII